jgi:hypothetical protein
MRRLFIALLFPILFSACGQPESPLPEEKPMRPGFSAGAIIVGPTAEGHVYAHYEDAADRFPPPRLLFFGSSDSFSKATDALLRSLYSGTGVTVSTFHFDFDSSPGPRLTYKVLVPDSIIVVTSTGAASPLVHPTPADIRRLILSSPGTP